MYTPPKEELKATTQINYNSTFGTDDSASGTSDGSLGSSVVVVVVVVLDVLVVVVVGLVVVVVVVQTPPETLPSMFSNNASKAARLSSPRAVA